MSKVDIVLDIETVVEPVTASEVEKYMAEYQPPSNYKTADAILRHRTKAEAEAVDTLLDKKRFSIGGKRMISAALGIVESGGVKEIEAWSGEDLSVITMGLVNYLNRFREYRLIGFNINGFDLPEIAKSFWLTKVKPKYKPTKWDIVDLSKHPFQKTKLKDAVKAFGIEAIGNNGADVAQMYQDGRWEDIEAYNRDDVRITGELYLAASTIYTF